MPETIDLAEAERRFEKCVLRAEFGEEIVILRDGAPVARLGAVDAERRLRKNHRRGSRFSRARKAGHRRENHRLEKRGESLTIRRFAPNAEFASHVHHRQYRRS